MEMTAEYVLSELEKHAEVLRGFGVKKIGLFGSVARGESKPNSDLDFVVELERLTYRDYFGLLAFLQDLFPGGIDLVTSSSVREELKPYIMQDIVYAEGI
jgi:predicted nucleotidyltransferase